MSEDGVSSMIEGFDRHHIGGVQPRRTQPKPAPKQPGNQLVPDASSSSTTDQDQLGATEPQAHVQVRKTVVFRQTWRQHSHVQACKFGTRVALLLHSAAKCMACMFLLLAGVSSYAMAVPLSAGSLGVNVPLPQPCALALAPAHAEQHVLQ